MEKNIDNNKMQYKPPYGDLTEINSCRLILDFLGKDLLVEIVSNYLDILGSSAAVYEKNENYALGIFSSGWCQFLDRTSRELCGTPENRKALESGKWLCHESCWTQASKVAIETGQPVDIECYGGIRLFAVPIIAGQEVIGSMKFGYGIPPRRIKKLRQIAKELGTTVDKLFTLAKEYKSQNSYIVENCKKQLITAAQLVGLVFKNKRLREQYKQADILLRESEERHRTLFETMAQRVVYQDASGKIFSASPAAEQILGLTLSQM